MFPLIDEEGNVVGQATRKYCHSGSMVLHPVIHLHLMDEEGRICLQKRSIHKDIAPGLWDTAVGGHVDYGERIGEALQREAREELGLQIPSIYTETERAPRLLFQYIWQSSRERELVTAFGFVTDQTPQPDHDEVDEVRWWTLDELQALQGKGFFTQQFDQQELPHLLASLRDGFMHT